MAFQTHYKAVIIGGGHNGLVAASYLARAGLSVLLLEKNYLLGGAAVSTRIFKGVDANLSRYSYLLSLFPKQIMDDLDLKIESRRRRIASFTPILPKKNGTNPITTSTSVNSSHQALMISNDSEIQTAASFRAITGSDEHYLNYQRLGRWTNLLAQRVFPTLTKPLMTREQMKSLFEDDKEARLAWDMLVEQPLGESFEDLFQDDVIRGSIFTDALVGTLSYGRDPTLLQNRCFLFHVIGNSTGEWRVPVGGMGGVTQQLAHRATKYGAQLMTGATVQTVQSDGHHADISFLHGDQTITVHADYVLSNVASPLLHQMMGTSTSNVTHHHQDVSSSEGSSFKVNMVLERLPRLKVQGYTSEDAFSGTFHFNESYKQQEAAYRSAIAGEMPLEPPGEVYCHTLTDNSIMSRELIQRGYQTLTLFGFNMPARLFRTDNTSARAEALRRYLFGINQHLQDPIESCLAFDADGLPCMEAKSAIDLETELGLPGGHIFHNNLSWPFVDDDIDSSSSSLMMRQQWGVETTQPNVFICGSSALRGGCVSGIPGHNAAMAVLNSIQQQQQRVN